MTTCGGVTNNNYSTTVDGSTFTNGSDHVAREMRCGVRSLLDAWRPVLGALLVTSCSAASTPDPVPIPTGPPGDSQYALTYGTLQGDAHSKCLWLGDASPDDPLAVKGRVTVVWPHGYSALFDPVRLVGPDGRVVARQGDRLKLGGGEGIAAAFDLGDCDVTHLERLWASGSVEMIPKTTSP